MMTPRIYFYANCGDFKKLPLGGGEVGNRRTLTLFHEIGYQVVHIEKYKSLKLQNKFLNFLTVTFIAGCNLLCYFFILLFGRRKMSAVHISAFYGQMVYFEYLLVFISKFLGYKTIYEMRGGGADRFYSENGRFYRKIFNGIINNCDCVFSQGLENFDLLESINAKREIFYYPNYVDNDFLPKTYLPKSLQEINLIYFGRLSKEKNIDLIIDLAKTVKKKYSHTNLTLIGQFKTTEYQNKILERIKNENLSDFVKVLPQCFRDSLIEFLKDSHFLIFPSTEPREGHSNSITEAMAYGIVPISSSQGFSKSVLSDERLIVKDLNVKEFSMAIDNIISHEQFENISRSMYKRVKDNFVYSVIHQGFKEEYCKLIENQ